MNRNLDTVYFRVKRDGKWGNVCFSDMTPDERNAVIGDRPLEWWRMLAYILGDTIREIGDELDLVRE